jgi:hypothetical protein
MASGNTSSQKLMWLMEPGVGRGRGGEGVAGGGARFDCPVATGTNRFFVGLYRSPLVSKAAWYCDILFSTKSTAGVWSLNVGNGLLGGPGVWLGWGAWPDIGAVVSLAGKPLKKRMFRFAAQTNEPLR